MLLSMRNIHKSFDGVPVLEAVRFDLQLGEVHILAGENGAGKTTLIKILAGVHTDYDGEIEMDGRRVRFTSPHDAARRGISVIHQEMSLIGSLPVIDNIFLGREMRRRYSAGLLVDRDRQKAKAQRLCESLGLDLDLNREVDDYPLSIQTRIEIVKALAFDARILIMDEPTSALSEPEIERLFQVIAELKRHGKSVLYITHRMEEIYRIGDRITVLRDGRWIGTSPASQLAEGELIRWMIGRELAADFPTGSDRTGTERLRVEHFCVGPPDASATRAGCWLVKDVSFAVKAGEVVGIAGLQGSGTGTLLAGLFGVWPNAVRGDVYLDGQILSLRSPHAAMQQGLAYVPSDRKGTGLILGFDTARNIALASLDAISPWGLLQRRKEEEMAERQVRSLSIRGAAPSKEVQYLSGGNQQKVLLGKWIETRPRVFLLDEPTRGIDVGAKQEIYGLIRRWKADGIAIVLITSELPELIGLSDRVLVMHRGQISGEFSREQATREKILRAAMGTAWTS